MPKTMLLLQDRLDTPIGELLLLADREGNLRVTDWTDHEQRMHQLLTRHYGKDRFTLQNVRNPHGLTHALEGYFSGDLAVIDTLPVRTEGTAFQRKVWNALRTIPCGATISYMELATRIGQPSAVRAVGLANGANPIGVVVPCHRVIGANGSLTGYGGGLHRKSWLLNHESRTKDQPQIALF